MEPVTTVPQIKESQISPTVNQSSLIPQRVISMDVYRGFVMLLMMAEVLSFNHVSRALPESGFWKWLYFHQDHVPWVGCSLHDLIQPSFSFLVGVALPYSIASRMARGFGKTALFAHALWRSLLLVVIGIFLRSMHSDQTNFTFEDTLTQIGLGYPILFILGFFSARIQILSLVIILVGYWLAFALYPLPPENFDYAAVAVPSDWPHHLQGFGAHWNKNSNLAWAFDQWFLNLFPREKPFIRNGGGYATLSFIPTLGTMILGLLAGKLLKKKNSDKKKILALVLPGIVLIVLGLLLQLTGINPIVKRIWTPAWTLFSGGWCFLLLALFYAIIEVARFRTWSFPLMVIGMNSIAAYVIAHVLPDFITRSFSTHLGEQYDKIFGPAYASLVSGFLVLAVEFLILYWMYRKKIFIKV